MSEFFGALDRAGRERVLRTQASSPRVTADPSTSPAASGKAPLAAPPLFDPPTTAAELADRSHRVDASLVSLLNPASFEAEQYRVLRHVVETLSKAANFKIVAITRPGDGDGNTSTAINLAGPLAQSADPRGLLTASDRRRAPVKRQLGPRGS